METTLVHLRLEPDEVAALDKMAGKALNRQAIARMLLIAAIEAVQANGGKVHLPPQFTITDDSPEVISNRINPPTHKRK